MTLSIFPSRADDQTKIVALGKETNTFPNSESQLESELHQNLATILVAAVEDQFAGYIDFWTIEDEIHIMGLSVAAEFRRQGIARRFLEEILQKNTNARRVYIEVRKRNFGAIGFYKSMGFRELSVRQAYYPDGDDAVNLMLERP